MRFAERNGTAIDVYQAATQMTDESGQAYPQTIDKLLDNAVGPLGYYGAFIANVHTDSAQSEVSDAIIASAKARGVPVVSGLQMLQWLDGRNASSFDSLAWSHNILSFHISVEGGADGLEAMIPLDSRAGELTDLSCNGKPVAHSTQTIKGVQYAIFAAAAATCKADYSSLKTE